MKKIIPILAAALIAFSAARAQQQPQEPTTFERHDTVKVVLYVYTDSVALTEQKLKAYKVFEIRKGDQSGQLYSQAKKWLTRDKKPMQENKPVCNEILFAWKDDEIKKPPVKQ
jgi:hypothetical protein